ncbi:MAG: hypothetical protein ACKO2G_04745 [Verrucomicrobiales bacterium]
MNSRERILAAIEHRQPDKVPVDLGATPSSGISAIAYGKLKAHLGLAGGNTHVYDVVQQLAQPEDFILDRFGIDVVDIGRTFNTRASAWQPTTLMDGQPALYPAWFHPERQPDGSFIARMKDGLDIGHMPARGTFSIKRIAPTSTITHPITAIWTRKWDGFSGPRSFIARGLTRPIQGSGKPCVRTRSSCVAPATAPS